MISIFRADGTASARDNRRGSGPHSAAHCRHLSNGIEAARAELTVASCPLDHYFSQVTAIDPLASLSDTACSLTITAERYGWAREIVDLPGNRCRSSGARSELVRCRAAVSPSASGEPDAAGAGHDTPLLNRRWPTDRPFSNRPSIHSSARVGVPPPQVTRPARSTDDPFAAGWANGSHSLYIAFWPIGLTTMIQGRYSCGSMLFATSFSVPRSPAPRSIRIWN
jgi:hypothetical protein